jgi:hypothetical protein
MGVLLVRVLTSLLTCLGMLAIGRQLGMRWAIVAAGLIAVGAILVWWMLSLPSGLPFISVFPGLPVVGAALGVLLGWLSMRGCD